MNQTSILFDKVNYLLLAKAMVLVGILFQYFKDCKSSLLIRNCSHKSISFIV